MRDVYVISAVRSAIGRFGGVFKNHTPVDLAAPVMDAAVTRAGLPKDALDLVVFGNVLRAGQGQLVPRQAAIEAGIPNTVDAMAVDMVCSSGMMSTMNGATMIKAGEADLILAGGVESMSGAGFYLTSDVRWGYKFVMGDGADVIDIMFRDGLSDPMSGEAMGEQTERLVKEKGVTREALDEIAAMSHRRAAEATSACHFAGEIVPVEYRERRETKVLENDEGIRPGTTAEALADLPPAFTEDGVLTAGNSSQISDGAAALLLAGKEAVDAYGLTPIARVLGSAWAAGEPWRFPEAPLPAVDRVTEKLGMDVDDFDLVENNEAFALNSVLMKRQLGVPYDKLNVHGGAIALGHPIGCSGARITVTLIHALRQHDGERGLASICHGTGGGTALALELA